MIMFVLLVKRVSTLEPTKCFVYFPELYYVLAYNKKFSQ